jgi:hypothetical protein
VLTRPAFLRLVSGAHERAGDFQAKIERAAAIDLLIWIKEHGRGLAWPHTLCQGQNIMNSVAANHAASQAIDSQNTMLFRFMNFGS